MNARQRRKHWRAECRRVMAGGLVFAKSPPAWARKSAAEMIREIRALLGHSPIADAAIYGLPRPDTRFVPFVVPL